MVGGQQQSDLAKITHVIALTELLYQLERLVRKARAPCDQAGGGSSSQSATRLHPDSPRKPVELIANVLE